MNRQISLQLDQAVKHIYHTLMKTIIEQGELHIISKIAIGKVTINSPEIGKQTCMKIGRIVSLRAISNIIKCKIPVKVDRSVKNDREMKINIFLLFKISKYMFKINRFLMQPNIG